MYGVQGIRSLFEKLGMFRDLLKIKNYRLPRFVQFKTQFCNLIVGIVLPTDGNENRELDPN